nr:hypothetical protein [Candidatus Accumulibacter sp. ACC005]
MYTTYSEKPNSALRTVCKVRLTNGFEVIRRHQAGEGHTCRSTSDGIVLIPWRVV